MKLVSLQLLRQNMSSAVHLLKYDSDDVTIRVLTRQDHILLREDI